MNTKFNIYDSVWLMFNNKPAIVKVIGISICADKAQTICVKYAVEKCDKLYSVNENRVFATKEELREYVFADNEIEIQQQDEQMQKVLNTKIIDCNLSVRTKNTLHNFDILTIGDLIGCSAKKDLLKVRGFGRVCLQEVRKFLAQFDLKLKGD